MPSIRHHLTTAEAHLTLARANLESAFEHTIDQKYDSRWTTAIDEAISANARATIHVYNIKTNIEPPATTQPYSLRLSSTPGDP